jgi:hypothetical protein
MNRSSTLVSSISLLTGIAIGALAMFMLDPVQGNRRRALARDQLYSAKVHVGKWANARSRDITNLTKGLCAKTSRVLSRSHREQNAQRSNVQRQEAAL